MIRLGNPWHDENYDGVVVKIPKTMVDINKLDAMLKEFAACLDKEHELSRFDPDFERSLHELRNFRDKSEYIQAKKQAKKRRVELDREWRRKRLAREWMEIAWDERKEPVDQQELYISGCKFPYDYLFTDQKKGLRKKALEEIKDLLDEFTTTKQFFDFFQENGYQTLCHTLQGLTFGEHWRLPVDKQPIYLDAYFNLAIRVGVLAVKYYVDSNRYYIVAIDQENVGGRMTGTLVFDPRHRDMETLYYRDFENDGVRLKKKQ